MTGDITRAIQFDRAEQGRDRHFGRDRFTAACHEQRVIDFYRNLGPSFFGAIVSICSVRSAPSGSQRAPDSCPTLVTVLGELDVSTAPILRACFGGIDGHVDVDCSGLEHVDTEGLEVLASTQARVDANFVFVDPRRSLLMLFGATGLLCESRDPID
jgi:anti-anti-sigma regulatory factor